MKTFHYLLLALSLLAATVSADNFNAESYLEENWGITSAAPAASVTAFALALSSASISIEAEYSKATSSAASLWSVLDSRISNSYASVVQGSAQSAVSRYHITSAEEGPSWSGVTATGEAAMPTPGAYAVAMGGLMGMGMGMAMLV